VAGAAPARRTPLQKLFSAFPGGWPGLGLILLRVAVASYVVLYGLILFASSDVARLLAWPASLLNILVGLAILAGFLTPLAGAISAVGALALGFSRLTAMDACKWSDTTTAFLIAIVSVALILLGPGAMSVDAKLFGRREIILP